MFKLITEKTRPSVSIPFFHETNYIDQKYNEYVRKNYIVTGKLISSERSMSTDNLTTTLITIWDSQNSLTNFINDLFCIDNFLKPSTEYEHLNNITTKNLTDFNLFQPTWKQINADDYFKNIKIPEDWDTLEDFVDWYCEQKMPLMIPWNAEVIKSDDAAAICIFRKGHYQVEFYLEYPNMFIHKHSHPRMEVITMNLGGGGNWSPNTKLGVSTIWGGLNSKVISGAYHGGDNQMVNGAGFVTLAFQRWENLNEMTSAAIQWKGLLQGPIQKELIKKHYPNTLVTDGYADISKNMTDNNINDDK